MSPFINKVQIPSSPRLVRLFKPTLLLVIVGNCHRQLLYKKKNPIAVFMYALKAAESRRQYDILYYKPTENQVMEDYLKATDLLSSIITYNDKEIDVE